MCGLGLGAAMNRKCEHCGSETPEGARFCSHCGKPFIDNIETLGSDLQYEPTVPQLKKAEPERPGAAFGIAAEVSFVLGLFVPMLVMILPVLATVILAIVAFTRNERHRGWSVAAAVLSIVVFIGAQQSLSSHSITAATPGEVATAQQSVKVSDWNWVRDPSFGTKGSVIWTVVVQNLTDKPIRNARIVFTSYDKSGHILASDFTFVGPIAPNGSQSTKSYADYFGSEDKASVQVAEVNFEGS
jgi:hypothetical protein